MEWMEESATLIDETALELEEANKKRDHERDAGWDEWQASALKLGAKDMHRLTRLKARWTPATTKRQGNTTVDPAQLLEHEVDTLRCFWKLALSPPRAEIPDRLAFDRATLTEIRAAASTFGASTGLSLDATNPRFLGVVVR